MFWILGVFCPYQPWYALVHFSLHHQSPLESKFNDQTQLKHVFPYMYNDTELKKNLNIPACLLHNRLASTPADGQVSLKSYLPSKKIYPGLSDGDFFRAMNCRRIHKVSVFSIPKKATPHILSQSKINYLPLTS